MSASRGVLACKVASDPSWPVFMACNMSRASAPRTSPTMMRSGRMRRQLRTRSRWVTSPRPSMLGGRDSRRTTWSCLSCSSAASSTVTMRSSWGMNPDRQLSMVVLPVPVPPEMRMLSRASTMPWSTSAMSRVMARKRIRSSMVSFSLANLRMDSAGPSMASGGMMALTREPSGRRASTMGEDSSTRRPTRDTMRSMIFFKWSLSLKRDSVSTSLPERST